MVWYQTRGLVESRVRWRLWCAMLVPILTCWFMCRANVKLCKHGCMGLGPQVLCAVSDTLCSRCACNIKLHLPSGTVKTVLIWWLQIINFSFYPLHCVLSMITVFGSDNVYTASNMTESQMWLQSLSAVAVPLLMDSCQSYLTKSCRCGCVCTTREFSLFSLNLVSYFPKSMLTSGTCI